VFGVVFVALSGWAAFRPRSFVRVIANFGDYNAHLVHDFAACSATFGIGLLVAYRVRSWRVPALTLAAIWNGLHAVSHLADIAASRPAAVGPVEAALLVIVTLTLVACAIVEHRQHSAHTAPTP
jgi:hypothetical protein